MANGAPYGTPGHRSLDPEDVLKLSQDHEYRLAICQYILELAQSILKGDADLGMDETNVHKLLVKFYWLLHQIP
jgi:hypothetical protein